MAHPALFALCLAALLVPPGARALTLAEAVAEARAKNHDVLRAREASAQRQGQIREVKSRVYPQLGAEGSYGRGYDESIRDSFPGSSPAARDSWGLKATVSQLVFSWGKVATAIEMAEASLGQADRERAATERRVALAVHEAFYGTLLAQRLVTVAAERLAQRERHLDVAQKRYDAGVVNEFEVIRARADVANARTPLIQAQNRVRQAEARLNHLLARAPDAPVAVEGELAHHPLAPVTLEALVARAVERRPELAALRIAREVAEGNLRIARAENKPQVTAFGEYGFAAADLDRLGPSRERWALGLVASVPLFDGWRTRGLVEQAASGVRDVGLAEAQLRQAIELEAKIALDALGEAREVIAAASASITQAEEALALAETSYRYGVATTLDVADAEFGLAAARTDHARAVHDHLVAEARLRAVMDDL